MEMQGNVFPHWRFCCKHQANVKDTQRIVMEAWISTYNSVFFLNSLICVHKSLTWKYHSSEYRFWNHQNETETTWKKFKHFISKRGSQRQIWHFDIILGGSLPQLCFELRVDWENRLPFNDISRALMSLQCISHLFYVLLKHLNYQKYF